jgi:hypothetical protein
MKKFFSFILLVSLFFAACSGDMDSSVEGFSQDAKKQMEERQIMDSIVDGRSTAIRLDFTPNDGHRIYIQNARMTTDMADTTEITSYVAQALVEIPFKDTTVCNYSNTKILFDGKPLEGGVETTPYGTGFVARDFMKAYDQTHTITIQLDSLLCGNIRETHVLVPSTKPGAIAYTELGFDPQGFDLPYPRGHFFAKVHAAYYWPDYKVWADTANSKCFLKTATNTMDLHMTFEKKAEDDYDYPSAFVAVHDSLKLENFLQGDTAATLNCAIVYQTWMVPAKIDSLKYETEPVTFKVARKLRIGSAYWRGGSLFLKVQGENAFTNNIWVKVVKNGKAEYRHVARYEENDDGFTYIRIPVASIYDDPTSSTEKDSVQVLAAFRVKTFVLDEERQIREQLDYNNFGFDSSVPYDTLLLAQIFESVPYTNGSVPSDFYYIDMIKVGGYVSENDNYY